MPVIFPGSSCDVGAPGVLAEILDRSAVLKREEFSWRGQLIASGCYLLNGGQDHGRLFLSVNFFSERIVKRSVQKR